MAIEAVNPATGERLRTYEQISSEAVRSILAKSQAAFEQWRRTDFPERTAKMKKASGILRAKRGEYARLMAEEMGKPLPQAEAEIDKCALGCDFYAEHAQDFLRPEWISTDASKSYVSFQPLGVILAVMPWNFPFWQVFRFAVPSLMAGNAAVLKHASNVPGCALAIEQVVVEAGFPENLFRSLMIGSADVAQVIENPIVKAVTLTGSTAAGKAVAAKAGSALKKTVLELGGSDPYVILEDANLGSAVEICVDSRLINSGQSCVAAKRFIVVESLRKPFEELFVAKMKTKKIGNPMEPGVDVGPLARHDLRDELHSQVTRSVERGGSLLLGGQIPEDKGAFYPPTVLSNVRKGMPAYDEELFGPVAAIIPVKNEDEAIRVANDTVFGLGAAVFTADEERGERIAAQWLEAGCCFVNTFVKSDPRLPFGGVKGSGYGRELSSFGIREFVNIKTVYVA